MTKSILKKIIKNVLYEIINEGDTICAWCKKIIKKRDIPGNRDSHGICKDCAEKIRKKHGLNNKKEPETITHKT